MPEVHLPRILVIGAGSRGNAYARALVYPPLSAKDSTPQCKFVGVAEPDEGKRRRFCKDYRVGEDGVVVSDWTELLSEAGKAALVKAEVNSVIIATLDDTHLEIVEALRPFNFHFLCEKPLSTTLEHCRQLRDIVNIGPDDPPTKKEVVFGIGHVLRYSPHNRLLRKLLCEDKIIGEVVSMDHTEPVGWWHFAHSYVRGNWRNLKISAPSLLTKSCHDIDVALWLLTHPAKHGKSSHYPTHITSFGSLSYFHKRSKPELAGDATNCFSCPAETECMYSAKNIYLGLNIGVEGWPNKIVAPQIADIEDWPDQAKVLRDTLSSPTSNYGRCVYESDNDVVDNQVVTLNFEADDEHTAKVATIRMVAFSEKICERQTQIYGTLGEIKADSRTITVTDFKSGRTKTYTPHEFEGQGHGGGDYGLAVAFVEAVTLALNGATVKEAQWARLGTDINEAWDSHKMVFLAEKARLESRVVRWDETE